jgi:hypothetical protein
MKNFFGILFILVGVGLVGLGIMALTNNHTRSQTFGDRFSSSFNSDYRQQKEAQQIVGLGASGGGAVLLIIGIAMVSTKSKKTRSKEFELEARKKIEAQKLREKKILAKAEAEAKVAAENKVLSQETQRVSQAIAGKTAEVAPKSEAKAEQNKQDDLESKMAKIERLGELKEKGLLTDEEFAAEKKKILDA